MNGLCVLWLEDGRFKTLAGLVRDPVCGMLLDPAQAAASLELRAGLVYLCARGCRDEYVEQERLRDEDRAVSPS